MHSSDVRTSAGTTGGSPSWCAPLTIVVTGAAGVRRATRLGARLTVALALLVASAAAWTPAPVAAAPLSFMYGVGDDNNIYEINPVLQTVTGTISTASLGLTGSTPNAFALDRSREQVLFLGSDKNMYFWDRDANALGQVATAAQLDLADKTIPRDATFHDDQFWFFGYDDNILHRVTIEYGGNGLPTGIGSRATTLIDLSNQPNPSNPLSFGDIDINPLTGMLYGSTLPLGVGGRGEFFSLSLADLANSYTVIASGKEIGLQIGFNADYSKLYGQDFVSGDWYDINLATGDFVSLGYVSPSYARFRDMAGGLVAVPEPGTLMLAIGGLAVAGMMGWSRGRRPARGGLQAAVTGLLLIGGISSLAVAQDEAVYVSQVDEEGNVTPFVTSATATLAGPSGLAFDTVGNLYVSQFDAGIVTRITTGGVATNVATGLGNAWGLTVDGAGNLFVAGSQENEFGSPSVIWKIPATLEGFAAPVVFWTGATAPAYESVTHVAVSGSSLYFSMTSSGEDAEENFLQTAGIKVLGLDDPEGTPADFITPIENQSITPITLGPDSTRFLFAAIRGFDPLQDASITTVWSFDSSGLGTPLIELESTLWGLAYGPDGFVYASRPFEDDVIRFDPLNPGSGDFEIFATGFQSPDGIAFNGSTLAVANYEAAPVPEPATIMLLVTGAAGLAVRGLGRRGNTRCGTCPAGL